MDLKNDCSNINAFRRAISDVDLAEFLVLTRYLTCLANCLSIYTYCFLLQ